MGQRHQNSQPETSDSAWLNTLIDTFERTEELGSVPCDATTVSATMSSLQGQPSLGAAIGQRRRKATLAFQH